MAGKDLRAAYEKARREYQQAVAESKVAAAKRADEIDKEIEELERNKDVYQQAQERVAASSGAWKRRQQYVRNVAARNYRNISQAAVFGKKEVEEKSKFEIPDKITSEEELNDVKKKMEDLVEELTEIHPDLPESVQDILKDYDTYKDAPFFQEMLKNEKQEGLLEKLHDSIQGQQKEKDKYIEKKKKRSCPQSVDDIINYGLYGKKEVTDSLNAEYNKLVECQKDYNEKKWEYKKYKNGLDEKQKRKYEDAKLYQKLTDRQSYDKIKEDNKLWLDRLVGRLKDAEKIDENKKLVEQLKKNMYMKKDDSLLEAFYKEENALKEIEMQDDRRVLRIASLEVDFSKRAKLSEKERNEADNLINELISEYNKNNENEGIRVNSVQDYYKALEEEAKFKNMPEMPTSIKDLQYLENMENNIESCGNSEVDKSLRQAIDKYSNAIKMDDKSALLPDTFTELSKLRNENKGLFENKKKKIDELLKDPENAVRSLDEYFDLVKQESELQNKIKELEKKIKKPNTELSTKKYQYSLELLTISARRTDAELMIENRIKTYNAYIIREYNIKTYNVGKSKDMQTSALEEAREELEKAAKEYNEAIKKKQEVLAKQNEGMKRLIKDKIIIKAKEKNEKAKKKIDEMKKAHEKNRKTIDKIIKNDVKKENWKEKDDLQRLEDAKKESEKKLQKAKNAMEKELEKAISNEEKNTQERWKAEDKLYKSYQNEVEAAIKEQKAKLQTMINEERKRNEDKKQSKENNIRDCKRNQLKEAESDRRWNLVKKFAAEKVKNCVDWMNKGLRNMKLGVELAQIKAKLKADEDKLKELKTQIENNEYAINRNLKSSESKDRSNSEQMDSRILENKKTIEQLEQEIKNLNEAAQEKQKAINKVIGYQAKDTDLLSQVNDVLKKALEETLKKNGTTDEDMKAEAEMKTGDLEKELETALAQNNKWMEQFEADEAAINDVTKTMIPFFNPDNEIKVTIAVKALETATNFVIGRINKLRGADQPEPIKNVNFTESIKNFNDYLEGKLEKEPEPTFLEQCAEALDNGFKLFSTYVEIVNNLEHEYSANFQTSNSYLKSLEKEKELFKEYKKNHENLTEYEARMAFEQEQFEMNKTAANSRAKLYDGAGQELQHEIEEMEKDLNKLKTQKELPNEKAFDDEADKKRNVKKAARREMDSDFAAKVKVGKQAEAEKQALEQAEAQKQALEQAHAQAVQTGAERDQINKPYEFSSVMLAREDNLAFLGQLSGVVIAQDGKEPDMNAAFDAMSRIYINGINAVAMLGMEEKYQQALAGGEQEKQEFMKSVQTFGEELKNGLMARTQGSMNPQDYSSQVISVENENMLLSAVTVVAASDDVKEKVDGINKTMKSANADFNDFRVEASKRIMEREKQTEKQKDKMITALHRSRDLYFKAPQSGRGIR